MELPFLPEDACVMKNCEGEVMQLTQEQRRSVIVMKPKSMINCLIWWFFVMTN